MSTPNDQTILRPPRGRAKVVRDAFRLLLHRTCERVAAGVRSPATLAMQREHVRYLLERLSPRTPLERVTPARIARLLELERRGRRGRQLAPGTLRQRASTLSQALELARGRAPRLPEIPFRYVPRTEHLPDFAAYQRLRDALPTHRRIWLAVAAWTGQRRADVEAMRREDLDVERRQVLIRSTKTKRPPRWFHAAPELLAELAAHVEQLPPGAKLVAPWPHVSSQLTRLSARLGLPRTTAHRLRHTFFTWYVQANGFTAELLELGGWKDLTIPSRVYAHAAPKRLQQQIERMHRMVVPRRRAAQKISRKREPEPGSVGAVPNVVRSADVPSSADPGSAHDGHAKATGTDRGGAAPSAEILALAATAPAVGAEGIEPSTNGLRVWVRPSALSSAKRVRVGSRGESHANEARTSRRAAAVAAREQA